MIKIYNSNTSLKDSRNERKIPCLKNYLLIFLLIFINLVEFSNNAYGVNASVNNNVRNVTGVECLTSEFDEEEFDTDEIDGEIKNKKLPDPCYESDYDMDKQVCKVGGFPAFLDVFTNEDMTWNYGNQACLAYVISTGITLQAIFMAARYYCPMPGFFAQGSADLASDVKTASQTGAQAGAQAGTQTGVQAGTQTGAQAGAQAGTQTATKATSKAAAKEASNVTKLEKGKDTVGKMFVGASSTPIQSAFNKVRNFCKRTSGVSSPWSSASMVLDPFMLIEIGYYAFACYGLMPCCIAFGTTSAAYTTAIAILGGMYLNARTAYLNTEVCGEGYRTWKKSTDPSEPNKIGVWQKEKGFYAKCLENFFKGANHTLRFSEIESPPKDHVAYKRLMKFKTYATTYGLNTNSADSINDCMVNDDGVARDTQKTLENIYYREYLFRGIEYADSGPGECKNPTWKPELMKKYFGYTDENQKYYFRGSAEAPNYDCARFLAAGTRNEEGLKAFECCKKRSMGAICLERKITGNYKFCSMDDGECNINLGNFDHPQAAPTKYDVSEAETDPRFICAKTYNHCPFDHNLAGGTDFGQQYPKRPSIMTNFCQYLRHCVKRVPYSRVIPNDPDSFFVAGACSNLMGDSQFLYDEINVKYSPIRSRNFSAPIIQCVKESIENNFLQIVGETKCATSDFVYDPIKKLCVSLSTPGVTNSNFLFVKGDKRGITLFQKLQNQFRNIIRIVLVLSVVMFGYSTLFAVPEMHINKKTILVFLIKIGLVSFFALGNAWHGVFINQILNISTEISNITFLPDTKSKDGCEFPKKNYQYIDKLRNLELNDLSSSASLPPQYPPGKNYLRIWDTLDCKLVRAIGYGPNVDTANIAKMIFAGFITGGVGIVFFLASFALAFMLLSIIFRAIQITIMSLLAVVLLVYISPITITCSLFERTKGIFENWYKQLLGYILQPMILFAYLGLFITVIDSVFIGKATFKAIPQGKYFELPEPNCSGAEDSSLFCIFNFPKFKNYTGLEFFDLAIPVLVGLNPEKVNTIIKGAIILYVMYSFMDKVSFVARKLVGGQELSADKAPDIMGVAKKAMRAVQKRALNLTKRSAMQVGGMAAKSARFGLSRGKRGSPTDDKKSDSGDSNKNDASSGGESSGSGGSSDSGGGSSDKI